MVAGQKSGAVGASMAGKIKTACMLVGITLLFFYDLPFSLAKSKRPNIHKSINGIILFVIIK